MFEEIKTLSAIITLTILIIMIVINLITIIIGKTIKSEEYNNEMYQICANITIFLAATNMFISIVAIVLEIVLLQLLTL